MAKITASVFTSHVPAIGAALDLGKSQEPYWQPLFAGYVSSKHAVIGLTKTLAKELGPRGITVNAVCPGWVKTVASLRSLKAMSERSGRPEQDLLDEIVATQALPGFMDPADITGPYLFFASPWAVNVTGQSLGVDRGEVPW